jgi:hypothetical protein
MASVAPGTLVRADKRVDSNELVVVQGHDHPLLMKRALSAADVAWVAGEAPDAPSYPYRKDALPPSRCGPCTLSKVAQSEIKVDFSAPQWGGVDAGAVGRALRPGYVTWAVGVIT